MKCIHTYVVRSPQIVKKCQTMLIVNHGKSPCHIQSDTELAHASEMDSGLLNITIPAHQHLRTFENSTRPTEISKAQVSTTFDEIMEQTLPLQVYSISEQDVLPAELPKQYRLWYNL